MESNKLDLFCKTERNIKTKFKIWCLQKTFKNKKGETANRDLSFSYDELKETYRIIGLKLLEIGKDETSN